jgi:hypothetical protein
MLRHPPRLTKEDPAVNCPPLPLYQTNSLHFMCASTIPTLCRVWGPSPNPDDWVISLSTAVPLRTPWLAAWLPGMAITPPSITWHYRGWHEQPSRSLGPSFPPSRTSIRRCERKAWIIVEDSSHPSHRLFSLLSHSKWYRCIKSDTNRLLNIFYSQAIRLLNS